jgi:hypothetical protein
MSRRNRMANSSRFPNVGRAPVILEFTSTTCRAGYAGDAQPRRQVVLPIINADSNSATHDPLTAVLAVHHVAARLMQDVFDQLGQDPSERHCLIVTQGLHPVNHTDIVKRLQQVLWNLGVPAIRFLPSLLHIALAISPVVSRSTGTPISTATPANTTGLVCLVTPSETHCVVFSSDAVLPFTYQVVLTTTSTTDNNENNPNQDNMNNSINATGIIQALLQCLEATPRDLRKGAAANLTFAGEVCTEQPDLERQMAVHLKRVLSRSQPQPQQQSEASDQEPENDPAETTAFTKINFEYTAVPVATSQLRCLADLIAVVQLPIRPDLCTWIGVSLWAACWHGRLSTGSTSSTVVHSASNVSGTGSTGSGREELAPSESSVFAWTKRPE